MLAPHGGPRASVRRASISRPIKSLRAGFDPSRQPSPSPSPPSPQAVAAEEAVEEAAEAVMDAPMRGTLSARFVAVYDFRAEDPKTELTVRKGEIVVTRPDLARATADGWMLVQSVDDETRNGHVPEAYMHPIGDIQPCSPGSMLQMTASPRRHRKDARRAPWSGARSPRTSGAWLAPAPSYAHCEPPPPRRRPTATSGLHYGSPTSRRRAPRFDDDLSSFFFRVADESLATS